MSAARAAGVQTPAVTPDIALVAANMFGPIIEPACKDAPLPEDWLLPMRIGDVDACTGPTQNDEPEKVKLSGSVLSVTTSLCAGVGNAPLYSTVMKCHAPTVSVMAGLLTARSEAEAD